MNTGGWQSGPKRSTQRGKREYSRLRNAKRAAARMAQMEGEAEEQGREGSNFEEGGSRGIREEATEIYSDPVKKRSVFSRYD